MAVFTTVKDLNTLYPTADELYNTGSTKLCKEKKHHCVEMFYCTRTPCIKITRIIAKSIIMKKATCSFLPSLNLKLFMIISHYVNYFIFFSHLQIQQGDGNSHQTFWFRFTAAAHLSAEHP